MQRLILILCLIALPLRAQDAGPLQAALQVDAPAVERASRGTVGEVLDRLAATGSPNLQGFLEAWRNKGVVMREADGTFFLGERDGDVYALTDIDTGATTVAGRREVKELKPNAGVRGEIATALIRFQLTDQRPAARRRALAAVERNPSSELLDPLRRSLEGEPDPGIAASKAATLRRLEAGFADDPALRIAAIEALSGGLAIEDRAALSRILQTRRVVSKAGAVPDGVIVAARIEPGADMSETDAYEALVAERLAPPRVTSDARNAALAAAIEDGTVAGVPVATLDNEEARWAAYDALAALGAVPARVTDTAFAQALETHAILDVYLERDGDVIAAAHDASEAIKARLGLHRAADLGLDALSLASIYFLAAVGLAVTFGVMGVINMAHGEFIMIGAYTGYLVQRVVPDYTLSLIVALPVAFLVAGAAGVALERLVVRHLMHRPLETLLATFGISIALQQIAKNIFGTQAVPLTSPAWLAGSWAISDAISISWIRVAIFVLAALFLCLIVYVLRRTRLGLEVRAVTQNRGMAASMGIDPDRIGMATFGLGSGIAGVAGVAIGLYAQVTSEMGSGYIVQSFMTVVVGGVGSVLGTLAGAGMIGGMQKGIEWLNPSNTLAAQTFMILFVIVFIQFRPRGIVPQRGRFAA